MSLRYAARFAALVLVAGSLLAAALVAPAARAQGRSGDAGTDLRYNDRPLLLIPDSDADRVMLFDAQTGDLVDDSFIDDDARLATPIAAIVHPDGDGILVADQVNDAIYEYDLGGNFVGVFAPASGAPSSTIDNPRGMTVDARDGTILVCIASGANADAVARFAPDGTFVEPFIAAGAGGLDGPYDLAFRANDVLVSGSGSDAVHVFDLSGQYVEDFAAISSVPEQIFVNDAGNVLVANFTIPTTGIYEFLADGTPVGVYTGGEAGFRGVYELPGGTFLATTGNGVFEIDRNDQRVEEKLLGVSARFIDFVPVGTIPVELTGFEAVPEPGGAVRLTWTTATETNNAGFAVEHAAPGATGFREVAFVDGAGTTTEPQTYAYRVGDLAPGPHRFRLRQVDVDGATAFSDVLEVSVAGQTALAPVYPNPVRTTATVRFTTARDAEAVRVELFDTLGRRVRTLYDGPARADAPQTLTLDARTLASGVYVVRLTGPGTAPATRSVVVVR
jgi:DNA-binding beta-propeller fold protein YncE